MRLGACAAGAAAAVLFAGSPAMAAEAAKSGAAAKAVVKPELAEAVAKEKTARIDKLLAAGVGIDERYLEGRTALFYAASQGDDGLVGRLLQAGAQVDARDVSGATPLVAALRNPSTRWSVVKLLLDKGADVNAVDGEGRTPLMTAVLRAPAILDTQGQIAMVEGLLAAGADPAMADKMGATALHFAAYVGEPRKMLELLIARASDPNATTASGANVLMMAAQNRQRASVDFLLARGFRPVRIKAVGAPEPLGQDVSIRANALAQDWTAQFLTRKGQVAEAGPAFAAAVDDYERAAVEADRVAGLYAIEVEKEKKDRSAQQLSAGIASVLSVGMALAAGGGVYYLYSPVLASKLERDQQNLAALRTEAAESRARAAVLRTQTQ